jgi:hypothetical protein
MWFNVYTIYIVDVDVLMLVRFGSEAPVFKLPKDRTR